MSGIHPVVLVLLLATTPTLAHPLDYAVDDTVQWVSLDDAIEASVESEKPVLIYISAPWCGPCRLMERDVFPRTGILLRRFELARLRFDDSSSRVELQSVNRTEAEWSHHFGAEVTPTFVFVDHEGAVITRISGALDDRSFGLLLAYVVTGAYRLKSFEAYVDQTGQADTS